MTIQTDVVIVGAGPTGLFQVFELGLLGIQAHVIDSLRQIGGQCTALYPEKPIYDIPALPVCSAQELIDRLSQQIKPFNAQFHLKQEVTTLIPREDGRFTLKTSAGKAFDTATVIIAGGLGSFQPRRLRLAGIEQFEGASLNYKVTNRAKYQDKDLVILGGGDSALDWALELYETARTITLIHRREEFRAAPASVAQMKDLVASDERIRYLIGKAVAFQTAQDRLTALVVKTPDDQERIINLDELLVFWGLSPSLGPIEQWGLTIDKRQIQVDTEKFQTNIPGIFAVGDINTYSGKKKLILSGFHEAALAAFGVYQHLHPNKKVFLQYTTTSPIMHQRLGVADNTAV